MKKLKRKIDQIRRQLDNLLIELAVARKVREHAWKTKAPDFIDKSMEFVQSANNDLFMAIVAINGVNDEKG